jgi:hypothetical protein
MLSEKRLSEIRVRWGELQDKKQKREWLVGMFLANALLHLCPHCYTGNITNPIPGVQEPGGGVRYCCGTCSAQWVIKAAGVILGEKGQFTDLRALLEKYVAAYKSKGLPVPPGY